MRECRTYGSVRGVGDNAHPYRDSFGALDHGMIGRGRGGGETARSLIHNPIGATVVCGLGRKVEAKRFANHTGEEPAEAP
jgi:hypothetical protein